MLAVVRTARMSRGARGRIRSAVGQGMFIHMTLVGTVQMPIMQIIDMTFMFDGGMPAVWTVRMGVLLMRFVGAHRGCLLFLGRRKAGVKIRTTPLCGHLCVSKIVKRYGRFN
jgi:hypothetical protein